MPNLRPFSSSLSLLALMGAVPAFADVTPADVWADWQAQYEALGQSISAEEVSEDGNTLTLRGFTSDYSDAEVTMIGRMEEIVLTDNGDGTVAITGSDLYELAIAIEPEFGGDEVNIGIDIALNDMETTASGDPAAVTYAYAASSIVATEGEITGGDGPQPEVDFEIRMTDVVGEYLIDITDPDDVTYSGTGGFSGMLGTLDVTPPPGEGGRAKFSFAIGATEASGGGFFGNFLDIAENPELAPEGFDLRSEYTYESVSIEVNVQDPIDPFSLFYSNGGGSIVTVFSDAELDYDVSAQNTDLRITARDLPVPIEASIGSSEIAFRVPMQASDELQDVSARLAYQDVEISDQIWALADPMQAFPRDPISVVADVSGTVQMFIDIFSAAPEDFDTPPGEIRDLTLNELRVAIGGAELTGTGDLDFAPDQIVPMPVGSVDLQLSGGNALLDTLQQTGLIPIEQLAMARGMLGAFTRPGAAPDTMETNIEFTEGGGITANGVPLQ